MTTLTRAEREVLVLFGEGHSYDEIAQLRGSSWDTVKNLLERARKKLGCTDSRTAYVELRRRERQYERRREQGK